MSSGTTGKGPSIAELQKVIREKRHIEFILVSGQKIKGTLKWFDETAYQVVLENGEAITLLKNAIVGYRTFST